MSAPVNARRRHFDATDAGPPLDPVIRTLLCLGCLTLLVVAQVGCSASSITRNGAIPAPEIKRILSPTEAAELGARLANDECARLYHKRPFTPDQHEAILTNGIYQWWHLDVGGRGGFSAKVTFDGDGSHPQVEVYYSTDIRRPLSTQPPTR
jgi:hypothetical protein